MDKEALCSQLESIRSLLTGTEPLFKEFIANKEIDIKERWDTFVHYGSLMLPVEQKAVELQELKTINSDLFTILNSNYAQYEIIYFQTIINELEQLEVTELDLNKLKEEILEIGFCGYIR